MIKAVFFDFDDTILDAMDCHKEAIRLAFEFFGYNYNEIRAKSEHVDLVGKTVLDALTTRKETAGISEEELPMKKLAEKRKEYFFALLPNAKFLPGAKDAIELARKKCEVVAIVSSGNRQYIEQVMNSYDLMKNIDFVISAEDLKKGKPDPECYLLAYQKVAKTIKKDECLVVEDSENGVIAANSAGLKVAFVPSIYNKFDPVGKYDFKLKSLEEFAKIF